MVTIDTVLLFVVAASSAIPAYYAWSDRRFRVEVFRVKNPIKEPIESDWRILIRYPSKVLTRCNVVLDGVNLRWDGVVSYEKYLGLGYGGNVRVPKGLEKDASKVELRDGDKTREDYIFNEIPILSE